MIRRDAIVVGAGASGLAAAKDLAAAGLSVAVLEARGRSGGRIATVHDPSWPLPIELGPEFIHGRPEETLALVRAARLLAVRLGDVHWVPDGPLRGRRGALRGPARWKRVDFWEVADAITSRMRDSGRDRSVAEFLESRPQRGLFTRSRRDLFLSIVEGYHAAFAETISEQSLSTRGESPGGHEQYRIINGYDRLTGWLAREAEGASNGGSATIHFDAPVRTIRWDRRSVEVETVSGGRSERYTARRAIVTVSPGVWKAAEGSEGAIRFDPDLPAKRRALEKIEMGGVRKIVFRFRERFWDVASDAAADPRARTRARPALGFFHARGAAIPTWWTEDPLELPVLTGWAGGPAAAALATCGPDELAGRALATLARLLKIPQRRLSARLEAWRTHDWQADPFARGAYSYLGPGGVPARRAFARPVAGVLFFAGEATDADQSGTVAGALASGRRAARELLGAARSGDSRRAKGEGRKAKGA